MLDRGDDPLAVHVTAASALSILKELLEQRGKSFQSRAFTEGMYQAALSRRQGKPPMQMGEEVDRVVGLILAGIEDGSIRSSSDVNLSLSKGDEYELLRHITAPFNFLKHASRDPAGLIDEGEVKPIEATIYAVAAYSMLFPGDHLPPEVMSFVDSHVDEGIPRLDS